eukprot:1037501-Heterocapsa_arctica.AAC.1
MEVNVDVEPLSEGVDEEWGMGLAQYARAAPAAAMHLSDTSVWRVPSCPPVAVLDLCQTQSRKQSR